MRILIVEDDTVLADGLTSSLRGSGYAVDWVQNGIMANQFLTSQEFDLVILDLGLPQMDGFNVLQRLRQRKSRVPVLILTARDTLENRVKGLDLGADDYLAKPFDLPELEARVRALIRRSHGSGAAMLDFGKLRFDQAGHRVFIEGHPLDLSRRELGLLEILLLHAGKVVSKEQLIKHTYTWQEEVGDNAIEVSVHRLRKKLDDCVNIRTVRGLGYLLDQADEA